MRLRAACCGRSTAVCCSSLTSGGTGSSLLQHYVMRGARRGACASRMACRGASVASAGIAWLRAAWVRPHLLRVGGLLVLLRGVDRPNATSCLSSRGVLILITDTGTAMLDDAASERFNQSLHRLCGHYRAKFLPDPAGAVRGPQNFAKRIHSIAVWQTVVWHPFS